MRRVPRIEGRPSVVLVYGAPESGVSTVCASAVAGEPGKLALLDGKDPDFEAKLDTLLAAGMTETVVVDGRPHDGPDLQKLVDLGLIDSASGGLVRVLRSGRGHPDGPDIERMAWRHSLVQTSVQNEDAFDAACQLYLFVR